MPKFQRIPVDGSGSITVDLFNRLQTAIENALADNGATTETTRNISAGDYRLQSSDRFVIANSDGGAVRVILPVPQTRQYFTTKKSTASGNAVTIVFPDGSATPIDVVYGDDRTVTMLCDGKAWVRL